MKEKRKKERDRKVNKKGIKNFREIREEKGGIANIIYLQ